MKFKATDNIRLRSGPGTDNPQIGSVPIGTIVDCPDNNPAAWRVATLPGGQIGYCSSVYLQLVSDSQPAPTPIPPSPQNETFLLCPIQANDAAAKPVTSKTVKISAIIDHSDTAIDPTSSKNWGIHAKDQKVIAFNGEVGGNQPSSAPPYGYTNNTSTPFFSIKEINYVGASSDGTKATSYLNYDGHGGFDFSYPKLTPIVAAADGNLHKVADVDDATYHQGWNIQHTFSIKHPNGFTTTYRHCVKLEDSLEAQLGNDFKKTCPVKQGQVIAYVGDFGFPGSVHLHFEVRNPRGTMVDPYGDKLWAN